MTCGIVLPWNYLEPLSFAKMYYTFILFLLVVSELLSQQSCQGQWKPQAIHCTNLQTLLCIYYLIRVLGYGPETLSLGAISFKGLGNHGFPHTSVFCSS